MEFFLDTSNIDQIKKYKDYNIFSGVTTNPSLLSKEPGRPVENLKKICEIMKKFPVSAQVTETDIEKMVDQGKALSRISENIIVKLPANKTGFAALNELKKNNIKTNITLCFDPSLALMFAKAGATYVSMIMGRTEDFNLQQSSLISRTRKIFDNYSIKTKILGASFRNPVQVEYALSQGADILTIPPTTIDMIFENPLTKVGLIDFNTAWETINEKNRDDYGK